MNLIQALPCSRSGSAAAALVATLDKSPATTAAVHRLPEGVSWLQVRADLVGDVPAAWLREVFGGRLLYTLGGDAEGPDRGERLIAAAAQGYDLVELDAERDIRGDLLARIPPDQRLICWRGTAVDASELASRFRRLSRIEARSYLLIVHARRVSDGLAPVVPPIGGTTRRHGLRRRRVRALEPHPRPPHGRRPGLRWRPRQRPRDVEWPDPGAADRRIRPALAADGRSNLRDRRGGGEPVALPRPAQRRVSGAGLSGIVPPFSGRRVRGVLARGRREPGVRAGRPANPGLHGRFAEQGGGGHDDGFLRPGVARGRPRRTWCSAGDRPGWRPPPTRPEYSPTSTSGRSGDSELQSSAAGARRARTQQR